MKKISPHIFTLGFMVILNIVAIGFYIFLYTNVKEKNRHVSIVLNEIEAQTQKNISDQALRDIIVNTQGDREKIAGFVLDDDKVVDFINTMEALGPLSHTKVTTSAVNVNDTASASTTGYLSMQINVTGDWKSVMQFVSLAENVPYKVSVDTLSLSTANTTIIEPVGTTTEIKKKPKTAPVWQANVEVRVVKNKK